MTRRNNNVLVNDHLGKNGFNYLKKEAEDLLKNDTFEYIAFLILICIYKFTEKSDVDRNDRNIKRKNS